jgi:hypothetical protein
VPVFMFRAFEVREKEIQQWLKMKKNSQPVAGS